MPYLIAERNSPPVNTRHSVVHRAESGGLLNQPTIPDSMKNNCLITILLTAASATQLQAVNVAVNGGFETGDFTGWTQFPSGIQIVGAFSPTEGNFAVNIDNSGNGAANSIIKQSNLLAGSINPGDAISVSFDMRGTTAVGGIVFAEFFSEIDGGGISKSEILGGPLFADADPNIWTSFSFNTTAGPDVSGGITLQLGAVTGAAEGSVANVFYDNVKIDVVPEPASLGLFALSGLLFGARRRR